MHNLHRKLKVLHIVKGMDIGSVNGGAEGFALKLACALDKEQFDVKVCVFFKVGSPAEEMWAQKITDAGIDFFYVADWHGNDRFDVYMSGIRALREYVYIQNMDIAHSHFQLGHLAGLDLQFRHMVKKTVRTVQLMPESEWSPGLYGWARYQILTKWFFPILMDAEVGVSQAVVDELDNHYGARLFKRRAKLVYNAVTITPLEIFPPLASDSRAVIGVVGRLAEQKGHRYLMEALHIIKPELPDLQVWFIGDGELRSELELQVKQLNLEKMIRFLGRRNDVPDLLKQLNLMVLPSLYEGLPINILEGMAAGVPVIATDIPGTRELVRHNVTGWLVPPRDPWKLGKMILQVIRNQEMADKIRRQAFDELTRYSIDTSAECYAKIYDELLSTG